MKSELISIIVPVFNVEKYLRQCVDSIVTQTYKNLEIILIDDGSFDSSSQICDDYVKEDSRIKVIHKENEGLSEARNCGIDLAKGEYLGFVDSDDFIHNSMYEKLYRVMQKYGAEIGCCKYIEFENPDSITEKHQIRDIKVCNSIEAEERFYTPDRTETVVAWNKLYCKSLFQHIRYPKGKLHEDEYTTYKILYHAKKTVFLSEPLYYYRQRSNSIMSHISMKNLLDITEAMGEKIEYYELKKLEKLRQQEILAYMSHLIFAYEICTSKEDKKFFRNKYKNEYDVYIKNSHLCIRKKIRYMLFKLNYGLYKTFVMIEKKRKLAVSK